MHVTVDFKLWRSCFVHLSKFLFPCPTSRLGKMKVWGVEKVVKFGGGPCRELCESTFNCIECRVYFVLITFFFQHGTVLCMSSQRFFHGKFDFKNGLVVNNMTFGA